MSDSKVWGLNPQHGFWYFAGQSKRPFEIPIPPVEAEKLRASVAQALEQRQVCGF